MTNIFVGNLSYQTTQDDLLAAFSQFGNVERAALVTDRATGQPRGFGFVEMTNKDEAEEGDCAIKRHATQRSDYQRK